MGSGQASAGGRLIHWSKRAAVLTAGQVSAQGAAFAFLVVLAREYAPEDYGYIAFALGIGAFAGTVVSAGIPASLIRAFSRHRTDRAELDAWFSNAVAMLSALAAAASLTLFVMFRDPGVVLVMLGFTVLGVYQGMTRGLLMIGRLASFLMVANLLKICLLALVVVALGDPDRSVPLVISGSAPLIALIGYTSLLPLGLTLRPGTINRERARRMSRFSAFVMVSSLAHSAVPTSALVLLERSGGLTDVAQFSVALTLAVPLTLSIVGVNLVLYPKIAETDDPGKHSRMVLFAQAFSAAASLSIAGFYLLFADPVIGLVFGTNYLGARPVLQVLAVGYVFANAHVTFSAYWEGVGLPQVTAAWASVAAVVTSAMCVALVPSAGPAGAAAAITAGYGFAAALNLACWAFLRGRLLEYPARGRT